MEPIRLIDFDLVSPLRSQVVYHAVAHAMDQDSPDTIILVSPAAPYVCIGYHQELDKEVDLDYCAAHNLPVYRREVGGGAVYLDSNQIFAQWVFHRDRLPADLAERFALYVQPLVETYRALGVEAYLRPINDVHVAGKKIGGTGAAQIGIAEVVVGSLMLDFDKATMARVLKVPSEKMRDKVYQSLDQYMTTLAEQLDQLPGRDDIKALYIARCEEALGRPIIASRWSDREEAMARELDALFVAVEWLRQKGGLRQRGVKIHEDVHVVEGASKAPGGLIRVTARVHDHLLDDVLISGDFTMLPASGVAALEQSLAGTSLVEPALLERIKSVYQSQELQSPGVAPHDLAQAILAAAGMESG